jgi:hypothetical protein
MLVLPLLPAAAAAATPLAAQQVRRGVLHRQGKCLRTAMAAASLQQQHMRPM